MDTCSVRNAVLPPDVQAEEAVGVEHSPYGEAHGDATAPPVLMQPLAAAASSWEPSAPPVASHDQALRTQA